MLHINSAAYTRIAFLNLIFWSQVHFKLFSIVPYVMVSDHPYLGVQLSNNLGWKKHIDMVISKATNQLNFLRRNLSKSTFFCESLKVFRSAHYCSALKTAILLSTELSRTKGCLLKCCLFHCVMCTTGCACNSRLTHALYT